MISHLSTRGPRRVALERAREFIDQAHGQADDVPVVALDALDEERRAPAVRGSEGIPLVAQTPTAACALAEDLARLIDDMTMRQVPWDELDGLVPDLLDPYWQLTLKFLRIARQAWPALLRERGAIEPAARRDALIKAEAARLARSEASVVAAGSTGSIPATAELIATIAHLPHGAVVLPGLDTDLAAEAWRMIGGDALAPDRREQQLVVAANLLQTVERAKR